MWASACPWSTDGGRFSDRGWHMAAVRLPAAAKFAVKTDVYTAISTERSEARGICVLS